MSNPTWIKKYLKMKPEVTNIFDTLDQYREFCVEYGHVFDESHINSDRYSWFEFQKSLKGKEPKNQWAAAAEQFKRAQYQE